MHGQNHIKFVSHIFACSS